MADMPEHLHTRPVNWADTRERLPAHAPWTPPRADLSHMGGTIMGADELGRLDTYWWKYAADFYDGPLSGMVGTPAGDRWAEAFEQCDLDGEGYCDCYRRYLAFQLDQEQANAELARHARFQKFVGLHMDYAEGRRRVDEIPRPVAQWANFYDHPDIGPPDLAQARLVGYFEW